MKPWSIAACAVLGCIILFYAWFTSRAHPLSSSVGKTCIVQFKRNALGGAADLPVPPTTDTINGAKVSMAGKLQAVRNDGILMRINDKVTWVPMDSVLLVQVQP